MPYLGNYDELPAEELEREPLTFTLAGRDWTAVADVPVGLVFDLAEKQDLEDADAYLAFRDFLLHVVIPEQRDEFLVALKGAGLKQLIRLVQGVMAAVTGGPTSAPASSPA